MMNSAFMYFDYMGEIITNDSMRYELWECRVCRSLVRHVSVPAHFDHHGIA